jgi:CBS domain containing-hemolysin-like protein
MKNGNHYVKNKIMENITKEEIKEIMKKNIDWLSKDDSDPYHDLRDYVSLNEEDYEYIAGGVLYDLEQLFSKKRNMKIEKIKNKI